MPTLDACITETSTMLSSVAPSLPVIVSVSTPSTVFSTRGGDTVVLSGTSLGLEAADLVLTYNNSFTQARKRQYSTASCVVSSPNTVVTCMSVPGVGRDFRFQLAVDGGVSNWTGAAMAISYAPPVLQGFTGDGGARAATAGGQQVTIAGSGFGPVAEAAVEGVKYVAVGVANASFVAANCSVSKDHEQMTCTCHSRHSFELPVYVRSMVYILWWTLHVQFQSH
jgi:hypothetical protein